MTQEKQIILEVKKFRNLLKKFYKKKLKFGLVVEPGMRFMHYNILSPTLKETKITKHEVINASILVGINFKFIKFPINPPNKTMTNKYQ